MRKGKTAPQRPPRPPRLTNVADIKGPPRSGTLIHFTAEQWKQATARMRFKDVKRLPKHAVPLALHPFADGGVAIEPHCNEAGENCRPSFRHQVLPDGHKISIGCLCDPGDPPRLAPPPGCETELQIFPPRGRRLLPDLRFVCVNTGLCPTTCGWMRIPQRQRSGIWITVIACACSPLPAPRRGGGG